MARSNSEISCPACGSTKVIRKGIRKNQLKKIQKYKCKSCKKIFSLNPVKKTKYPSRIILNSISLYNLGYTQKEVSKLIAKKHHTSVPERTICSWVNRFKPILPFHKIRKQAIQLYSPKQIILTKRLSHGQVYKYKLHQAKLVLQKEYLGRKYYPLESYLLSIPTREFPNQFFKKEGNTSKNRASTLKFDFLKIRRIKSHNLANKLVEIGINLAKTNKQRHQSIQDFMLINDSSTITTEVPVYLTNNNINSLKKNGFKINITTNNPITGHIDVLQVRKNIIHILDYKPEAEKEKPVPQLILYALALASRTNLPIKSFKCAWFDEKKYYEFYPLHGVWPRKK
jgi:transposase-like protein